MRRVENCICFNNLKMVATDIIIQQGKIVIHGFCRIVCDERRFTRMSSRRLYRLLLLEFFLVLVIFLNLNDVHEA